MSNSNWKCTLISPAGDQVFIGHGPSYEEAFKDACLQMTLFDTPKRGPGMWELSKLPEKMGGDKKEEANGKNEEV